jgi:hypothetical protein
MEKIINFLSDNISYYGRNKIDLDSGILSLGWPGSGFVFSFRGTEARIKFGDFSSDRHFYFQISIDGKKENHCICASDQIIVLRGLSSKVHTVRVLKITECLQQVHVKEIAICGDEAKFMEAPTIPPIKFEFIGDSLTAGFGNMSEPDAGIYRASEQDITYSYSYLTAAKFKAEGRYICLSGKGIFNNWDGSKENRIPDFYDKTFIGEESFHNFNSWQPHIVFINAGTNDITAQTNPADFKDAYVSFVKNVRRLNPNAFIFCIHGVSTNAFENVFSEIEEILKNDVDFSSQIEFLKLTTVPSEFYGALGHPNSTAHARVARELLKPVKRVLHKSNLSID